MEVLPVHIGYIVDGNRRWANAHHMTTLQGHLAGYEALKTVLFDTIARGVPYVSAYVFSTENWNRSAVEVNYLMTLILRVLRDDIHLFIEQNVRLRIIGSRERLSKKVIQAIDNAETATAHLTGGQGLICLNYGGQLEIADAVTAMIKAGVNEQVITPARLAEFMYAPDVPACDLIVRTSGEQRLSNFMLWRSAYSELMFIDTLWPDMTKHDVTTILEAYTKRSRRFGG